VLDLPFAYSERLPRDVDTGLFSFRYQLPAGLRRLVAGRRVAIVNDVINAGSAVRGTLDDLRTAGANPVVIGALAVLGRPASQLAAENALALESIVELENEIWTPAECPLCAQNVPLTQGVGA
jgi:orotate phosphoribosyltransferase